MGIFDKKSKSTSTTNAVQTTQTANGENSTAVGLGNVSGSTFEISTTDHGAIAAGRDAVDAGAQIGIKGIEAATFQTGKALDVTGELINATARQHDNNLIFASDTIKTALDTATDQFKFSQQQTQQGIERAFASADKITRSDSTITMDALAKYGAIAAVVIVGLLVWGKMQ
jgi:hypothetical protein